VVSFGDTRVARLPDGTAVFDPVSVAIRILPEDAVALLDLMRTWIEAGCTDRDVLLERLLAELDAGSSGGQDDGFDPPRLDAASVRARFQEWVDLARHLYV
jgi:hypothetical protein